MIKPWLTNILANFRSMAEGDDSKKASFQLSFRWQICERRVDTVKSYKRDNLLLGVSF